MADPVYHLPQEEVQHYQYMLGNGYIHEVVNINTQKYVVFGVLDKPYIGIAWPTLNDKLEFSGDAFCEYYIPLQKLIMPHLKNKNIKILLFPRYTNAS